jgi:FkbM family methyltransferase
MQLRIGQSRFEADILAAFTVRRIEVEVPGLERPVSIRLGETDQEVFRKIFVRNEYGFVTPQGVGTIVDAGANVGYSVLWFRRQYPEARIVALEPDPENFAVLTANCGHLPGVTLLQAALWGSDGEVRIETRTSEGRDLRSWGRRTAALDPASAEAVVVPALSPRSVMERAGFSQIDLFKMDIEGAEKEVFEAPDTAWLHHVGVLTAEFHDRYRPGATAAAEAALAPLGFRARRKGENTWFTRG